MKAPWPPVSLDSTTAVGRHIVYKEETSSTQADLRDLALRGVGDGTVVVADYQRSGRGRGRNSWIAPKGCCLLFSWLARFRMPIEFASRLTMISSLAVADALKSFGVETGIKWPNDLVVGDRKICGILTETTAVGGEIDFAVVGIGVNVDWGSGELPEEIRRIAISMRMVVGSEIDRGALLVEMLSNLDQRYTALKSGWDPVAEWRGRLATLGKELCVSGELGSVCGIAEEVGGSGELILRKADGARAVVWSGLIQNGASEV